MHLVISKQGSWHAGAEWSVSWHQCKLLAMLFAQSPRTRWEVQEAYFGLPADRSQRTASVSASQRASLSRSLARLEASGVIERTTDGSVSLVSVADELREAILKNGHFYWGTFEEFKGFYQWRHRYLFGRR